MREPLAPKSSQSNSNSPDLLVVGSGVAGLSAAIEAAGCGMRVHLITKDAPEDSNSEKAQGGIAVALSEDDDVDLHHRDTMEAGDGLCDEDAVRVLVEEGPARITDLIAWGAAFDRDGAKLAFAQEGAHSARRVLHASGDSTGREIVRALIEKASSHPRIAFHAGTYTANLLVEGGRCAGLLCLDGPGGEPRVERGTVLLAAGGCGQVYAETTNPEQATGDGVAMAYLAGALVRDMEFVQFHPTSLAIEGAPRFLLSEALRGEGGYLRGIDGRRFMLQADPARAELASRDIVARAIIREMNESGAACVHLDLTHLDAAHLARRFPRIHRTCLGHGIDITRDPIPVSPSAHYMMGGVATDLWGRATLPGLYAAGEVACVGAHGANRLASNSLLEGLVFGARAGRAAAEDRGARAKPFRAGRPAKLSGEWSGGGWAGVAARSLPPFPPEKAAGAAERVRRIAWERAGILRDGPGLMEGAAELRALGEPRAEVSPTRSGAESRNLLVVASLITASALLRKESRGAHYRTDYPARNDAGYRRSCFLGVDGSVREVEPPRQR
jgi:L-aspartate oxidase